MLVFLKKQKNNLNLELLTWMGSMSLINLIK